VSDLGRTVRQCPLASTAAGGAKKITVTGSTAVIAGERVNGTTKSGRARVVSIDDETVAVLRQRKADQAAEQLHAGDSWRGTKDRHVIRSTEAVSADIFAQAVKAA
jgi:hypothetical protein